MKTLLDKEIEALYKTVSIFENKDKTLNAYRDAWVRINNRFRTTSPPVFTKQRRGILATPSLEQCAKLCMDCKNCPVHQMTGLDPNSKIKDRQCHMPFYVLLYFGLRKWDEKKGVVKC